MNAAESHMPYMPPKFVARLGYAGNEVKQALDMKIDEWRAALKKGLQAGALPRYEEEVTYTVIQNRVIKCNIGYDTDLSSSNAKFYLSIKMSWSI